MMTFYSKDVSFNLTLWIWKIIYLQAYENQTKIFLNDVHKRLDSINQRIKENRDKHNEYLKELGLDEIK